MAALHGNHGDVVGLVLGRLLLVGAQAVLVHQALQNVDLKILQSLR